ncbi:hypothetical protein RX533_000845 [Proteus mirabilis]|uniref:hypothetical protein n=1 Tax=Proteus mirabilis TaxID=584 RepID=UPI00157BEF87|nr:hypothetical protein [Proteus mirabilis]EKV1609710.1 hypothetical protein [Proteus mirabilis]EKV4201150.1 hypothetical protein [Proteus mirabilis]EKV5021622.1 hypothetical protein [Proteus mirabilis]EKV5438554.1 hypothetical protein [Proteus mirabilis]EKW2833515.1 hypothetical protein [Proteus mirabilis]
MKNLLLDITALAGVSAVMAGCYLKYGVANTLIIGGCIAIIYALAVAMRGKRVN